MSGLTSKQEAFCLAYVETSDASKAYRRAYNAQRMTDKSIWEQASRTLAKPEIAARIHGLREKAAAEMAKAKRYELEDAMSDCTRLAEQLKDSVHRNAPTLLGLIRLKAELNGLLVEARKNERSPIADMGADSVKAALAALAAIRKAKEKAAA